MYVSQTPWECHSDLFPISLNPKLHPRITWLDISKKEESVLTLRAADLARVRLGHGGEVDLVELLLLDQLPVDDPAVEEVRDIDGNVGLARVVVGQQTYVVVLPAEEVVDEEDGGILVVARHVAVVVGKLDLLAHGRATPGEGLETTRTERHDILRREGCWYRTRSMLPFSLEGNDE